MFAVNRSQHRSCQHWRPPRRNRIAQACLATESNRQVSIPSLPTRKQDTQTASVVYKHNALGQRVFKSEPQGDGSGPDPAVLGADFAAWLKKNFGWLYAAGQADASVGTAYAYADESTGIPGWALMGEYDNGSASGRGRTEYIWLPVQSEAAPLSTGPQSQSLAGAIPVGFIRNSRLYAIHTDHLGTPRLVTDDDGKPIWQWPYSAFGDNAATGVLRVTTNAASAITNQPVQLRATAPQEFNLRFPGQYFDSETKLAYNYFRNYQANTGRYTQSDPIGLDGGWNRFGYAGGNPMALIDPDGLKPLPGYARPNNAREGAGYHDPRGEFQCGMWHCPREDGICDATEFRRPNEFAPMATSIAPGETPRNCRCVRLVWIQDWRPPTPDERDASELYKNSKDAGGLLQRLLDAKRPVPLWHRIGGYGR